MLGICAQNLKCAEIFCDNFNKYAIYCKLCEWQTFCYEEFLLHFENTHKLANDFSCEYNKDLLKSNIVASYNERSSIDDNFTAKSNKNSIEIQQGCGENGAAFKDGKIVQASTTIAENCLEDSCSSNSSAKAKAKYCYKIRNEPNICPYCCKTFRRRYHLNNHINIHTGRKPHQCEICGQQFRAFSTLQRHLQTHKQKPQQYACKFCDKSFGVKAAQISHELRHTQQRQVTCTECSKCFYTVNQMETHKRRLHHVTVAEAGLAFACPYCAQCYRTASMLSTHKLRKHTIMSKYACELCSRKFVDAQHLANHMASLHVILPNKAV